MGVENNAMFRLGCRFACCDVESECTVCCDGWCLLYQYNTRGQLMSFVNDVLRTKSGQF